MEWAKSNVKLSNSNGEFQNKGRTVSFKQILYIFNIYKNSRR